MKEVTLQKPATTGSRQVRFSRPGEAQGKNGTNAIAGLNINNYEMVELRPLSARMGTMTVGAYINIPGEDLAAVRDALSGVIMYRAIIEERQKILDHIAEDGFYRYSKETKKMEVVHDNPTPYDVDNGHCEELANAIEARVPGAVATWNPEPSSIAHHCYVEYYGRYYDAEAPEGVDHPWELPLFKSYGLDECKWKDEVEEARKAAWEE